MNVITINGKRFETNGGSITIKNNIVLVNGKPIESGLQGIVELKVEGDLMNLKADCSVIVNGDVHGYVDAGGSVNCGEVGGDVDCGGSCHCGNINGNIDAGGSVSCTKKG